MPNTLEQSVEIAIREFKIEDLEELSGWWLEHEYKDHIWETKAQYEKRRDMVMPMIIGYKLDIYEQEYS